MVPTPVIKTGKLVDSHAIPMRHSCVLRDRDPLYEFCPKTTYVGRVQDIDCLVQV